MEPQKLEQGIERIRREISTQKLNMARVPQATIDSFKRIADNEFASDYGMTLTMLVRYYEGLLPSGLEDVQISIQELRARVEDLETKQPEKKDEENVRKNLAGQRIGGN